MYMSTQEWCAVVYKLCINRVGYQGVVTFKRSFSFYVCRSSNLNILYSTSFTSYNLTQVQTFLVE